VAGTFTPNELACNPHGIVRAGVHLVVLDATINAALSGQDRVKSTLALKNEIMREVLLHKGKMAPGRRPIGEGVVLGVAIGIVRRATATFLLHRVDADLQN
jgi:hypothetical protein